MTDSKFIKYTYKYLKCTIFIKSVVKNDPPTFDEFKHK